MDDDWDESPNFTADTLGLPTQFGSSKFDDQINHDGGFGGGFDGGFDGGFGGGSDQFGDKPRSRSNASGRSCFKCGEEGHMARDCQTESSGRGSQSDGRTWNNWNKDGNGERNNRGRGRGRGAGRPSSKPRSDAFGEEGDPFDNSANVGDKGCFKCGMTGHISRDCPNDEGQKRGCFKCGQLGHLSRDCTNPEASEEKKPRVPLYIPRDVNEDELFESGIEAGENFDAYENIPVKVSGADPIEPAVKTFESMRLRSLLLENIAKAGYKCPTPIQKHAIPNVLVERDIMACAQTGSGKTAAFLLPMLQYILENNCSNYAFEETAQPTGLVVCPTRELALQIMKEARKFSCGSVAKCCVAYGGVAGHHQLKSINSGCHILVATPGRLKDFLDKGKIAFDSLKFLVLDEADRMLDMGFLGAMKNLLNHSTMPSKEQRTTMMFSATFPNQIQELASQYLNNYLFIVVGTVGAANTDVHQEVLCVQKDEKRERLIEVIEGILANAEREKILIFVEQKRMADFVGSYLCERNYQATTIHGDRFQEQREQALATFRGGVHNILVATAVAARGLDIKGINVVINYDLPSEIDEYVHRIGRTGRVGNQGQAISFVDESSDGHIAGDLMKVLSEANQEVPDWLRQMAGVSGHLQNYRTPHGRQYAAADIRKVHGDQQSGGNLYLGGPQEVQEEEEW